MTDNEKKNLSWEDRQAWECGFTLKCCSCKYAKKGTVKNGDTEIDVYFCYRKRTPSESSPECRETGRVTKEWNGTCFGHVWKYAEGEQLIIEG